MAAEPAPFTPLDAPGGFPTAIDALEDDIDTGETPRTLLELRICTVAGAIRDRHRWWEKVSDQTIVAHWRAESVQPNDNEDAAVFNYALAETRWQAAHFPGPVHPAAADGTFCIDDMAPALLKRLLDGTEKIRATSPRDVHPGSNGLVVDLVHPSMYAYEQGVTPVIGDAAVLEAPAWDSFVGDGTARPQEPPGNVNQRMCSASGLAWLPAEFAVPANGKSCVINSYINSLHPHIHKDMYAAIADAFVVALPLFEAVLNSIGTDGQPREMPLRVPNDVVWIGEGDEGYVKYEGDTHPYANDSDFENSFIPEDRFILKMPEVPTEYAPYSILDGISLKGKHLQVIVKLASIELSPAQPKYEGGSWHVEGMRNERIVATTCMYLESENVAESSIEFRTAIMPPLYEQNDVIGVKKVYGLRNCGVLIQPRGVSRTLPGRALAWPNTLQHRVRPFELADKTRAGRRTILCFFLVDPTLRVRSTATVPPQLNSWIAREASVVLPKRLPTEVRDLVGSYAGGMSFEDACERRQRLMDERRAVVKESGEQLADPSESFFERIFSLCEH